jgi:hypothetical protein
MSQFGCIVPLPFKLSSYNVKIAFSLRSILVFNNSCWVIMLGFKALVVSRWAFGSLALVDEVRHDYEGVEVVVDQRGRSFLGP